MKALLKARLVVSVGILTAASVLIVGCTGAPDGTWGVTSVQSWAVSPTDDAVLLVDMAGSGIADSVRVEVVEETSRIVRLQGWAWSPNAPHAAIGIPCVVTVRLASPLGDRRVLDVYGNPIPHAK